MCHRPADRGCHALVRIEVRRLRRIGAMQAVCIGGLQAFVPMEVERVREGRKHRPKTIRTIMFPGYVLAKLPHGYAARHVPLVRGVVCMDGEPIPCPRGMCWT